MFIQRLAGRFTAVIHNTYNPNIHQQMHGQTAIYLSLEYNFKTKRQQTIYTYDINNLKTIMLKEAR